MVVALHLRSVVQCKLVGEGLLGVRHHVRAQKQVLHVLSSLIHENPHLGKVGIFVLFDEVYFVVI